eukprot:902758_1
MAVGKFGGLRGGEWSSLAHDGSDGDRFKETKIETINSSTIMFRHWKSKSSCYQTFYVRGEVECGIVQKYMQMTSKYHKWKGKFVWQVRKMRSKHQFWGQVRGRAYFYSVCFKKIATILGKDNPRNFTGHTMRRFGATRLADGGASVIQLKRYGVWKSNKVAETYAAQSMRSKCDIADRLQIRGDSSDKDGESADLSDKDGADGVIELVDFTGFALNNDDSGCVDLKKKKKKRKMKKRSKKKKKKMQNMMGNFNKLDCEDSEEEEEEEVVALKHRLERLEMLLAREMECKRKRKRNRKKGKKGKPKKRRRIGGRRCIRLYLDSDEGSPGSDSSRDS